MSNVTTSARARRLLFVGFAFVMAILFDVLFWKNLFGFNFFLFYIVGAGGFVALLLATRELRRLWPLWLVAPGAVLALDVMLYNNELVTGLVPLVSLGLAALAGVLATLKSSPHEFKLQNIPLFRNVFLPMKHVVHVCSDLFRSKESLRSELYKKILLGVVISLPILLVFVALFSGADSVFAHWVESIVDLNIRNADEIMWRTARTIFLTLIGAACMYVLLSEEHVLGKHERAVKKFDVTVTSVVLILVNILFILFTFIQIRYLFGDVRFVHEAGITFADYARSGFFQLVWVLVLTGLLLLFVFRSESHNGRSTSLTVLSLLLCAQVFVIALSALKRMGLYQDAYGFTTLRLYVEWFIYFVMVLYSFLAVGVIINWNFRKFFHAGLVFGVVAFTFVASLNVDRMIARKNVERYLSEGKLLDVEYLAETLSVDTAPEIVRLKDTLMDTSKAGTNYVDYLNMLRGMKYGLEKTYDSRLEYNVGKEKALDALKDIDSKFE